ncbi:MAG: nitroreductase family protein [Thermoleophilia bacterium]
MPDRRLAGAPARAGYAGEAAILEATSLGFATCWIGGGVRRDKVATFLELEAHEHVYSISARGYATDQPTTGERATAGLVRARNRKPMGKLAPECEAWPTWARTGVELARIAPSATNRQPWRFALEPTGVRDGNVRLFFEGKDTPVISKRLDCGMAMLHFELGVRSAGATGSWSLLEGNDVARWVGG